MSTGLPPALREAIARFVEGVAPKDLASRTALLTEIYRSGGGSDSAIRDRHDVAAYLTTRLPATYAAIAAALDAVKERAPLFTPANLLDVGAGPGTASWAASETWPLRSVTMLDRNPHFLVTARTLAAANPHSSLAAAHFVAGDVGIHFPPPFTGRGPISDSGAVAGPSGSSATRETEGGDGSYDLILAGYTFAELPTQARARVLSALWNACSGILVIVEPGTPAGYATILACRTQLLAAGARIVAPCPGNHLCPITAPDWCHFAARLPRLRAHMRAKEATLPFEDEKFSYLAVAREHIELAPVDARIISPPLASKPGVRLRLCTPSGLGDRVVLKRDKPSHKAVSRKTWGDAL